MQPAAASASPLAVAGGVVSEAQFAVNLRSLALTRAARMRGRNATDAKSCRQTHPAVGSVNRACMFGSHQVAPSAFHLPLHLPCARDLSSLL